MAYIGPLRKYPPCLLHRPQPHALHQRWPMIKHGPFILTIDYTGGALAEVAWDEVGDMRASLSIDAPRSSALQDC